ncbi:ankyrin repeat domain-containing protein 26-like [Suncus etruscus]|uniref:ankyrin repeat domain-containing protein 26-like n=1 Tax=Suncus etruscus TaxID=109475 RepID=UPI00210F5693|nr:ankyrin repeat domain-containing protein 26-like [Suncus etruscus]
MKKSFFGLWDASPRGDGGPEPGYRLRARDLGKIHQAASAGNVARVQHLLLLGKSGPDDRDKRHRTALHLACAGGHKEVVTLLVERKCQLNLYDSENRTALIKAVQCQKEECATILLEHGADPNLQDIGGNTALHYAVSSQNRAIAAKLLAHDADIKISNKDDLTPVLLAVKENKQEMADFLIKESNRYALGKMQSSCQATSEYALENIPKHSLQNNNPGVDDNSEEESLSRFSSKPGIDDSWPISDDDFDFEAKTVQKPNLTKLMAVSEHSQKNQAKGGIVRPANRVLFEDDNSDSENEDVLDTFPGSSVKVQDTSHPDLLSPEPVLKPLKSFATLDLPDERSIRPAVEQEKNNIDTIENVSQAQTKNGNLPCVDEA